jgi:alkylated DNA nucleotide flippase Atl1
MSRENDETRVAGELPEYAERVLEVAERIPAGRVMTYGDVAEWLEESGPRQVGRVMALYGGAVPWWRVVRADGVLLPGHELRALARYREEGTPLRGAASSAAGHLPRIDVRAARWDGGPAGAARPVGGRAAPGRGAPEPDGPRLDGTHDGPEPDGRDRTGRGGRGRSRAGRTGGDAGRSAICRRRP